MFEAIIFEMDGLMGDTEPLHLDSWNSLLQPHDALLNSTDLIPLLGRRDSEIAETLRRRYDLPLETFDIYEQHHDILMDVTEQADLDVQPGLYDLIELLNRFEVNKAIVTPGVKDYAYLVTEKLHVEDEFSIIINGEMVPEGEPGPYLLLAASETLAASPLNCLVLAATPNGVEAAHNAGMKCIAVPGRYIPRWRVSSADLVVSSLRDVTWPTLRSLWESTEAAERTRLRPQPLPEASPSPRTTRWAER